MTVRAVTRQVTSAHGHVQLWRDADGYDLEQDSRWDEIDPGLFGPDPRLEDFHQGRYAGRTRGTTRRVEPSLLNEHAGHEAGPDSRPACSATSPDRGQHPGTGRADRASATSGVPASSLEPHAGAPISSDVTRPGGNRAAS